MTINSKTTLIAVLSIAALSIAIASVQSIMTAQQPVKTLPASPQGEWVVIRQFNDSDMERKEMDTADSRHRRRPPNLPYEDYAKDYAYSVLLYHTGTGKVRHVTWPTYSTDAANMVVIESR